MVQLIEYISLINSINHMKTLKFICILSVISLVACTPKYIKEYKKAIVEKPETQAEKDKNLILEYLTNNKLEFQSTESGVYYSMDKQGTGDHPVGNSIVIMNYKGYTLDGNVFDSSYDREEPLEISLENVISGWTEVGQLLQVGGKGTFILPSAIAYGERGSGADIPANTVLVFEMELLDFYKPEDKEKRRIEKEQKTIEAHLAKNSLTAQKTESGIHYIIEKEGSGVHPAAEDIVRVHYKGTLLDGTVFDSSIERGEPIEFALDGVIKGWTEGIPLFSKGGKGTLFIPSHLAYGSNPRPGGKIKSNDVLIFEVELLDIITAAEYAAKEGKKFHEKLAAHIAPAKEKMGAKDDAALQAHIKKHKLDVQKTEDGIYYIIEKAGGEKKPNITSSVTVHYTGLLLDGTKFDSSVDRGQPATFPLTRVVPGWSLGIPLFGKGGKGTLLIPSHLAYGERGAGGDIGPNSCLIFEVEILDFK